MPRLRASTLPANSSGLGRFFSSCIVLAISESFVTMFLTLAKLSPSKAPLLDMLGNSNLAICLSIFLSWVNLPSMSTASGNLFMSWVKVITLVNCSIILFRLLRLLPFFMLSSQAVKKLLAKTSSESFLILSITSFKRPILPVTASDSGTGMVLSSWMNLATLVNISIALLAVPTSKLLSQLSIRLDQNPSPPISLKAPDIVVSVFFSKYTFWITAAPSGSGCSIILWIKSFTSVNILIALSIVLISKPLSQLSIKLDQKPLPPILPIAS